jgi:hypothetical protein
MLTMPIYFLFLVIYGGLLIGLYPSELDENQLYDEDGEALMSRVEIRDAQSLARRARGLGIFIILASFVNLVWDAYKISIFASYANVIHKK